jgi:hypothetical protein
VKTFPDESITHPQDLERSLPAGRFRGEHSRDRHHRYQAEVDDPDHGEKQGAGALSRLEQLDHSFSASIDLPR